MPDDVKIPISTPGAKAAGKDLKSVATNLRQVGRSATGAGQATSHATGRMGDDAQRAGQKVKQSAASWDTWKVAGLAAATAIGAAMRRVIANMQEHADLIRRDYQSFVDLTQQTDTRALAQIRGQSEAKTAAWLTKQSATYGIAPKDVRSAAFEIESGFKPEQVGGAAALTAMEQMAFKTMRSTGAGGKTVAGLEIAGYEAGLARTPAQFGAFLAKSTAYAGSSRMTLQDFGGIMSRLLPMAVNVGLDPDEFQSMAAAMSFRISDPGRLATSLEQLIRAAGVKSKPLTQFAAGQGREAGSMTASEVMGFQSQYISSAMKAGGPQGSAAAAEELGIPAELAQVYGVAFDPAVRERMVGLREGASGATFAAVIGERYQASIETPEGRTSRAGFQKTYQEQRRAIGEQDYQAALADAKTAEVAAEASGQGGIMDAARIAVWGEDARARGTMQGSFEMQLQMLARTSAQPGVSERATELLSAIRQRPTIEATTGVGQHGAMIEAATFLADQRQGVSYQGGTHYHSDGRNDPAGKPRTPAAVR